MMIKLLAYNILVMGRAAFMRVPVSEANDLNYLLWFDNFLFVYQFLFGLTKTACSH